MITISTMTFPYSISIPHSLLPGPVYRMERRLVVRPVCGIKKTMDEKQRLKQERRQEKKRRKDEAKRLKPHTIHLRRESKRIFSSAGHLE